MTTPRDDIAGLRKWNDEWPHWQFTEHQHTQLDSLLKERDALSARVKELEVEVEAMYTSLDANWKTHQRVVAAEARALRAEQERYEAYERLKPFAKDAAKCEKMNPNNSISHVTTARVHHLRSAANLVRRLSVGHEKEKKE